MRRSWRTWCRGSQTGDVAGATPEDYALIETSVVQYFDNSGKVVIQDRRTRARAKLDRERALRIENGDPAAIRLLTTELQQDILIHITATPTNQSSFGQAIRLNAKAVGTTDGRILGTGVRGHAAAAVEAACQRGDALPFGTVDGGDVAQVGERGLWQRHNRGAGLQDGDGG